VLGAVNSPQGYSTIETSRLRLIPLSLAQLVSCTQSLSQFEEQLGLRLEPGTLTVPALRACDIKIEKMHHAPLSEHAWYTYWLAITQEQPRGIGCLGFKGAPDDDGAVEIGYGIADAAQGLGYGTEAVRALIDWAFSFPSCRSVWGDPLKTNEASNRLLEACGARLVRETETSNVWSIER